MHYRRRAQKSSPSRPRREERRSGRRTRIQDRHATSNSAIQDLEAPSILDLTRHPAGPQSYRESRNVRWAPGCRLHVYCMCPLLESMKETRAFPPRKHRPKSDMTNRCLARDAWRWQRRLLLAYPASPKESTLCPSRYIHTQDPTVQRKTIQRKLTQRIIHRGGW